MQKYIGCQYINKNGKLCKQYSVFCKDSDGYKLYRHKYCKTHLKIISSQKIINFIYRNIKFFRLNRILKSIRCNYFEAYSSATLLSKYIKVLSIRTKYYKQYSFKILENNLLENRRLKNFSNLVLQKKKSNIFNIFYNNLIPSKFSKYSLKKRYFSFIEEYFLKYGVVKDDLCSICHGYITRKQVENYKVVDLLECNHYYHFSCINRWLMKNNKCPKCKKVVVDDDKKHCIYTTFILNYEFHQGKVINFNFPITEWQLKYYLINLNEIKDFIKYMIDLSKDNFVASIIDIKIESIIVMSKGKDICKIENENNENILSVTKYYLEYIQKFGKNDKNIIQKIKFK